MFCTDCGNKLTEDMIFCMYCGKALKVRQTVKYLYIGLGTLAFIIIVIIASVSLRANNRIGHLPSAGFERGTRHDGDTGRDAPVFNNDSTAPPGGLRNNPEGEIRQAVAAFGVDFNNVMDLSVYINGNNLDLSPLRKHVLHQKKRTGKEAPYRK